MNRIVSIIILVFKDKSSAFDTDSLPSSLLQNANEAMQIEEIDDILKHLYKIRETELSSYRSYPNEGVPYVCVSQENTQCTNQIAPCQDIAHTPCKSPDIIEYAQSRVKDLLPLGNAYYDNSLTVEKRNYSHNFIPTYPRDNNQETTLQDCTLNPYATNVASYSQEPSNNASLAYSNYERLHSTAIINDLYNYTQDCEHILQNKLKNTDNTTQTGNKFFSNDILQSRAGCNNQYKEVIMNSNLSDNIRLIEQGNLNANMFSYPDQNKRYPISMHNAPSTSTSGNQKHKVNFSTEQLTFEENGQAKPFRFILLVVLKNAFYYRFNISKLLQRPKQLYCKGKQITTPHLKLQKKLLAGFIKHTLEFVKTPGDLQKTDTAIFTSDNKLLLAEERKQLMNVIADSRSKKKTDIENYNTIKDYNKELNRKAKKMIRRTNYTKVCEFFTKKLTRAIMIFRYYDTFVCFMVPLYEISLFFDNNVKGFYEKHLNTPPLPDYSFYVDVKTVGNNTVFYWAVCWLYYFSNYCNTFNMFDKRLCTYTIIKKYPTNFFIDLLLLLYFAFKYEAGCIKSQKAPVKCIDRVKFNIEVVFFQSLKLLYNTFEPNLRILIECLKQTYSRKIYKYGRNNCIRLTLTTAENEELANILEPPLKTIIIELIALVEKADSITSCYT